MVGWVVPPPKRPEKTGEEFLEERVRKVRWLIKEGFLESERIIKAMLRVPREEFIPKMYRDYAYLEVPLPLPGHDGTISCPHSYPLFYEALELKEEHIFPISRITKRIKNIQKSLNACDLVNLCSKIPQNGKMRLDIHVFKFLLLRCSEQQILETDGTK